MRIWVIVILLGVLTSSCVIEEEEFLIIRNKHPSYPPVRYGSIESGVHEEEEVEERTFPERLPTPCLDTHSPGLFHVRQVDTGSFDRSTDGGEPTTALVIFDKSGSMSDGWITEDELDPDLEIMKWDAASDALIGAVTPIQDRVTVGAIFFPQPDNCFIAPIESNQQVFFRSGPKFLYRWEEVGHVNHPNGSTPLEGAFVAAQNAIEIACLEGRLEQRFIVIVLTDGQPNCDSDMEGVEELASKWLQHGIPTYVFGLPGSEEASYVLNRIAAAGGTETLVVPGGPGELSGGMGGIM